MEVDDLEGLGIKADDVGRPWMEADNVERLVMEADGTTYLVMRLCTLRNKVQHVSLYNFHTI